MTCRAFYPFIVTCNASQNKMVPVLTCVMAAINSRPLSRLFSFLNRLKFIRQKKRSLSCSGETAKRKDSFVLKMLENFPLRNTDPGDSFYEC